MELVEEKEVAWYPSGKCFDCPICFSEGLITVTMRAYEHFYGRHYYFQASFTCPNCGFYLAGDHGCFDGKYAIASLAEKMNNFVKEEFLSDENV